MRLKTRYLIVTSDDFGLSESVNEASVASFVRNGITSLTLMPPGPAFGHAVKLAKKHKIIHTGVHLTLTSEFPSRPWGPVTDPVAVPSLVTKKSTLHRTISEMAKHVRTEDVYSELDSQIQKVIAAGLIPTHLDCHMFALHIHVCQRPDLLPIFAELGQKYRLPLRAPFKREISRLEKSNVKLLKSSLYMTYDIPSRSKFTKYSGLIRKLPDGVSELILHCGFDNKELREITKRSGARQADYDFSCSEYLSDLLRSCRIQRISWREAAKLL